MAAATVKRAIKYSTEFNLFLIRRWDGTEVYRSEGEMLAAPMSEETTLKLRWLHLHCKDNPNQWVEY